ncbi:dephospho-CoA kinase [Pseudoflavitalea sp. G-6-1-2]|uniref:dephospho-CoA kinase n=1 Tax=Pseudoflavitalea sp. G-6-1-2 TaxID=2728841 RepID=UPI00146A3FA1|nr:dephospho-CoA kinase [Pseudoflavitalea sp. G-6-1-2]NML23425.1 dephospho-CoA kinase [Pseudoflavitalea sp. G-6-1-2]
MISIGITGGIGSGKSTVAKIFEVLGIPVYYADDAAKRLMNEDASLREAIIAAFGAESYVDGQLNRSYLSSAVFNNKEKLEQLNALVHPATILDGENWMLRQTTPYALKEAALFFESGSASSLDLVIGVYAPTALRIHRAMQRDNISREAVIARMSKQINENIKMRLCDFVIVNDEQHPVLPQVLALHQQLLKLAAAKN